jgi:hypothetical protein
MELVTQGIQKLNLENEVNTQFIQKFSKLGLKSLDLQEKEKILVGHIFLHTKLVKVRNTDKKYYIAVSEYYTEKKKNRIYPLSNKLNICQAKVLNNPLKYWYKYLKENYSFTKKILDETKIYQSHIQDNIVIYLIYTPILTKKIKEMKKTSVLHFYTDPTTGFDIENLYKQIISANFSSLNKKFYFFYNNIKVSLKERDFLEAIN